MAAMSAMGGLRTLLPKLSDVDAALAQDLPNEGRVPAIGYEPPAGRHDLASKSRKKIVR